MVGAGPPEARRSRWADPTLHPHKRESSFLPDARSRMVHGGFEGRKAAGRPVAMSEIRRNLRADQPSDLRTAAGEPASRSYGRINRNLTRLPRFAERFTPDI